MAYARRPAVRNRAALGHLGPFRLTYEWAKPSSCSSAAASKTCPTRRGRLRYWHEGRGRHAEEASSLAKLREKAWQFRVSKRATRTTCTNRSPTSCSPASARASRSQRRLHDEKHPSGDHGPHAATGQVSPGRTRSTLRDLNAAEVTFRRTCRWLPWRSPGVTNSRKVKNVEICPPFAAGRYAGGQRRTNYRRPPGGRPFRPPELISNFPAGLRRTTSRCPSMKPSPDVALYPGTGWYSPPTASRVFPTGYLRVRGAYRLAKFL